MDRDLRLVWLYCVIEDAVRQILGETRLRSRGSTPELTDGESLTIEIFGETLGLSLTATRRSGGLPATTCGTGSPASGQSGTSSGAASTCPG